MTTYRYSCDHEPRHIFTIEDIEYHACDRDGAAQFDGDIVFNLTGQSHFGQMPPELRKHMNMQWEEVVVPWADMRVVPVRPEFWGAIHDYAVSKKAKKIAFHCQAGHGRTGTALSAMLITQANYSAIEAVRVIRHFHCEECVESEGQCKYLMSLESWVTKKPPVGVVRTPPVKHSQYGHLIGD